MVCVREVPDEFRGGFGSFRTVLQYLLLVSGVVLHVHEDPLVLAKKNLASGSLFFAFANKDISIAQV